MTFSRPGIDWDAVRRCQRLLPVACLLSLFSTHADARDQLQGVFEGSIAWTDNIRATPDDPEPGSLVLPATADVFAVLSPGIVYAVEERDRAFRLGYRYTANLYFEHSETNAFANMLDWESFWILSSRTRLLLAASVTQSHFHSAGTLASSSATALNAIFPGTSPFIMGRAAQTLTLRPWNHWRLMQAAAANVLTPVFADTEAATTLVASNRFGADYFFRHDALGAEIGAEYARVSGRVDPTGFTPGDTQSQIISRALARWRSDWGRHFFSHLDAGPVHVYLLERNRHFWNPAGTASLGYTRREGDLSLTYRRDARTSLFLGQTFLINEVTLRGALPLSEDPEVDFATSAGYQRGRLIDANGDLATPIRVWLADVSLSWLALDHLRLGLRYQHAQQETDATRPPLPLSYVRNTVMATASFYYPPEREMPRRYRPPLRVDAEDATDDPLILRDQSEP